MLPTGRCEMISNPLLQGRRVETSCPTGWYQLGLPEAPYAGHTELAVAASGLVRLWAPPSGKRSACARLWHPWGAVAGLYTDRGDHKRMIGHAGRRGKVMGDFAGVEFLRRRIPWSRDPIKIQRGSAYAALGIQYHPFSVLSHVLISAGGPAQLLAAAESACSVQALQRYSGVPVLCLPRLPDGSAVDLAALDRIHWPKGITILSATAALADQIADQIFVAVDLWSV